MARLLVTYGTTDGHTARIARELGTVLRRRGHEADVVEASNAGAAKAYDGVIVAASVRRGRYQRSVVRWVAGNAGALAGKPAAFVSVSLGVLQRDDNVQAEIASIMTNFFRETGWQPGLHIAVAGALPYTRYNPLTRWLMKRIVAKAGGDTDTSRDYEYTDWDEVRAFAVRYADAIDSRATAGEALVNAR